MTTIDCYVCHTAAMLVKDDKPNNTDNDFGGKYVNCIQCGDHYITNGAINLLKDTKKHLVSHEIRKRYDAGEETLEIKMDDVRLLNNIPEIPLEKKADLLLRGFAKDAKKYNDKIDIKNPKYIAVIAAKDILEYDFVFSMLFNARLISGLKRDISPKQPLLYVDCTITSEGWMRVESLNKKTDSKQGFVAMWFDDEMQSAYEKGIKPAIEIQLDDLNTPTTQPTGLKALRIDEKLHNGKIDDEIIAEIQRSRFVVADFTNHRGGVYFEAGYALGLGIPVIWTCREDHIEKLHFDTRQYNHIVWKTAEELRTKLYHRIRATVGA